MQNFPKLYNNTLTIIQKFCMNLSYFSLVLFQNYDNDTLTTT